MVQRDTSHCSVHDSGQIKLRQTDPPSRSRAQPTTLVRFVLGNDRFPPIPIIEIPFDRLADTAVEGFGRGPAKLIADPAGIDRIPSIMPRPVGHKADLFCITLAIGAWAQLIKDLSLIHI